MQLKSPECVRIRIGALSQAPGVLFYAIRRVVASLKTPSELPSPFTVTQLRPRHPRPVQIALTLATP
jgi:hypothetical protein